MLTNVSSNVFSTAKSISIKPMVFAEWNQNIYNPPYITLAGTGVNSAGLSTSTTLTTVTGASAKPGFTTKKYIYENTDDTISYLVTTFVLPDVSQVSSAYKIITYAKTNKDYPIMLNISARGASTRYGSSNAEINSFGWTKIETYIGGSSPTDSFGAFEYDMFLNRFSTEDSFPIEVYFTEPQVYAITYFDYKYNSSYSTDSVFSNFRPGESYVNTGSSLFSFPSNFRSTSESSLECFPINQVTRYPRFFPVSSPLKFNKNSLVSDISQYKYFVSDTTNKSITGIYAGSGVMTNKLVIKLNTISRIPSIKITINGTDISVGGSTTISLAKDINKEDGGIREDAGTLVLYWNGSAWTRSRWTTMPTISSSGEITQYININKITVTYLSGQLRSEFDDLRERSIALSLDTTYLDEDTARLQVIEISPRLELDLTQYLMDLSINKSSDNKGTPLPISSMNSNDANINFSSIPLRNLSQIIPIFSNQSNYSGSALKNMLNKNVKFYINFYLENYADLDLLVQPNTLIPGGIFYSDQWSESDANQVSVQCFDITRYLQSVQASDYVSNKETSYDVISNLLDISGFTDYDDVQLFNVCNSKNTPVDLSYFYTNSKDTTIADALNKIFLPYQIVAYIDEYGVMRFKTLSDLITPGSADLVINDSNILDNGYAVVNKAKPGKISVRYELPKIKQSADIDNIAIQGDSPSFIYTTSNEVVWSQQNSDSVGMNYLANNMTRSQNYFELDSNGLLDIFHTYNRNYQGYAAIENEIVSFDYKEYRLYSSSGLNPVSSEYDYNAETFVYIKDDTELQSEISRFNKEYQVGLQTGSTGGSKPSRSTDVEATGVIAMVKRGLFGSSAAEHTVLSSSNAASKDMTCKFISNLNYATISNGTYGTSTNNEFLLDTPANSKTLLYPTTARNEVLTSEEIDYYQTYSTKIRLVDDTDKCSGGLFFNLSSNLSTFEDTYFLELVKYNTFEADGQTANSPAKFNYLLVFYKITEYTEELGAQYLAPEIIGYTDITTTVKNILNNTEKVLEEITLLDGSKSYQVKTDSRYQYFKLKAVTYKSTGSDGESNSVVNLMSVFLNNVEINGWRKPSGNNWVPFDRNTNTMLPKKIQYSTSITPGTIFGSFISRDPIAISGITYINDVLNNACGSVRELYATHKPLKERSVSYYFQSSEFLNGMVQNQNLLSTSQSYMMQTKPEVIGINTYDVQYTTPGALTVNIWPIEYLLNYFPGTGPADQKHIQQKEVGEYSLSYSGVLNTGFRGKFAIANNTSHMVYLKKDADQSKQTNVKLNLWTYEIIANSDQDIIERIIDPGNIAESVQIDSNWIQSKESANKIISIISNGIDYFSKDISLSIFGNPLVQIGDRVQITYPLAGINQQLYIVTSVAHDFSSGLDTKLGLNMINPGVSY